MWMGSRLQKERIAEPLRTDLRGGSRANYLLETLATTLAATGALTKFWSAEAFVSNGQRGMLVAMNERATASMI